jgi:hypothetical protein
MHSFSISNRAVIPAFNAATALQAWLRPGLLAYIVGAHVEQLRPHAERLFKERQAMLEDAAQKYPDGHEKAGQHVTTVHPSGAMMTLFKSPEAGADFATREGELMAAETTILVDDRLTIEHIRKLDSERLPAPRSLNGQPPSEDAIDFAAIMPLVHRAEYDGNGVAETRTPGDTSRARPGATISSS